MNKVLLIGPEYFGINESVEKAFLDKGFKTTVINFSESYPVNYKTKITHGLLNKLGIGYFMKRYNDEINKDIVEIYRSLEPDIVIIIKGHKIYQETLNEMKNSKLILWMMDSVKRVNEIWGTINTYDYVFVFEEDDVSFLSSKGIKSYYLPLALDRNKYWPIKNRKELDIVFIGSLYPERIKVLKEIIREFPQKNIVIYGKFPSWKIQLMNINLRIGKYRKYFNIKSVNPKDINVIYSKSKVILNLHLNFSLSGCNLRFFEIAGTKSLQIVNRKHLIDTYFNMEELVFDSYEDLIRIIKNVFDDNIETTSIIDKVYNEAIISHTYTNRIDVILNYLSKKN
ncbi:DUF3880 domain-containing protein [Pseudalkalibacillus sp. SCS-8]|uniref:CgeB family protein n=1 Tax=Pseudalkalibacillus nanhaiensis TaxID=3115291 RepID=UPI0032DB98A4